MVTKGLLVRLQAKAGKEQELQQLLESGQALVEQEPDTTAWLAVQFERPSSGSLTCFRTRRDGPLT
jgi:hypothetical protein